ncbi:zinc finger, CCHC-type containing protein [Tanacetum coccineum]
MEQKGYKTLLDLDEMSVDEAIGRLKTFEERLKSKKEIPVDSQESLIFTRHEGQRKPFRERGRFNQSRGRGQDKNNYQSKREERASFEEDTRDKSQVTSKNSKNNKNKRKFKSDDDKFTNKKATVTCWKCNKTGHMKKDCRSRKGNGGAGSNGSKDPEKQQG